MASSRAGIHIRTLLTAAIYRKVRKLNLRGKARFLPVANFFLLLEMFVLIWTTVYHGLKTLEYFSVLNWAAKRAKSKSVGEIVNMLSVDIEKVTLCLQVYLRSF